MSPPDETKICPSCGQEILRLAAVCKHCRHRFSGEAPSAANIPRLEREQSSPPSLWRLAFFGFLAALLVLVIVAVLGNHSSNQNEKSHETRIQVSETDLEDYLENGMRSTTGSEIDWIGCSTGGYEGETVDCDVTYENSSVQQILVEIEAVEPKLRVQISLDE